VHTAGDHGVGQGLVPDLLEKAGTCLDRLPGTRFVRPAEAAFQLYPGEKTIKTPFIKPHPTDLVITLNMAPPSSCFWYGYIPQVIM
jgi:hypothetical protein